MKKILFVFAIIALISIVPMVMADNKLEITDITVRVDGSKESGIDESGGTVDDVTPESELKVEINIKNMFDEDTEDLAIEDIEVEVILEDIDDGDDLEEEADQFDLDAEEKDEIELTFDIPLQVEEGSYDMYITIEGEDENGTEHNDSATLRIKVEKESHKLKIHKAVVTPNNIACGRTTALDLEIYNIGTHDEDVEMFIQNADLNIDISRNFTLDEDPDDDENVYDSMLTIELPDDASVGSYPISIRIEYDDGDEDEEKLADLVVSECNPAGTADDTTDDTSDDAADTTTDTTTTTTSTQTAADTTASTDVVDTTTPKVSYKQSASFKKNGISPTTMLIGLAYLIVIAIVVVIVVMLVKRK